MTQNVTIDETKMNWIGEVLNKKYIVIKKLGRGSYASVWMVVNKDNKKPYAIKINNTYDTCEGKTEAILLEKFKHLKIPHIVDIVEYFLCEPIGNYVSKKSSNKHVCIVMELMACSLYDLMKNKYNDGLPIKFVKRISYQIITTLSQIHEYGYVHTDIKPENILLSGISQQNEKILEKFISPNFEETVNIAKQQILKTGGIQNIKKLHNLAIKSAVNTIIFQTSELQNICESSDSDIEDSDNDCDCDKCQKNTKYIHNNDKSKKSLFMIDDKYINENCIVKIADLGTSLKVNNKNKYPIQTKYYKAPEIILHLQYNNTIDMWSIGCMLYELITGDILFDPPRAKNKNILHLCLIQEKLGIIYTDMFKHCPVFATEEYNKEFNKINFKSLESIIITNKHKFDDANLNIIDFIDFIHSCLSYDINNRLTSQHALSHKWIYN